MITIRGIGNVIAGPISAILIGPKRRIDLYAIEKYEGLVLFTGVAMLVSSLSIVGRLVKNGLVMIERNRR